MTIVNGATAQAAPQTSLSDGPREIVVAADGSGAYRTVQEAIAAAPTGTRSRPTRIRVRSGTYRELIYVQREKRFLRLAGEDPATTTIVYGLYASLPGPDGKPLGTFRTPTATFDGDDVTVENLAFVNDAGPKGQALAARVDGDRIIFRNCRFSGWQDTLFDNRGRHFYAGCTISGATDFIFGGGTAFFEDCRIICSGNGYVTAASTPEEQPFGFVFSKCSVVGAMPDIHSTLGRPWRDFAQTAWLECDLGKVVRPEGWSDWNGRNGTARYGEYRCFGPGADTKARVPWAKRLTGSEAAPMLSPERVLAGTDGWNPRAGFQSGAFVTTDVVYHEVAGERLTLDASVPESGDGPFPVVLMVHGGGWGSGDKQGDIAPLLLPLLADRFTCLTLNYRLAPKHCWPARQDDITAALRWIRENAATYKGDPARIALVGYSAGGQLASHAAVAYQEGNVRIAAFVGLAAPTDLIADTARRGGLSPSLKALFGTESEEVDDAVRARLQEMSSLERVSAATPPCLFVHGSEDKSVPPEQSTAFLRRLQAAGVPGELLLMPGAPHAVAQWSHFEPGWRKRVAEWLSKTLGAGGQ